MIRFFSIVVLVFLCARTTGQENVLPNGAPAHAASREMPKTGFEESPAPQNLVNNIQQGGVCLGGSVIGQTTYDLQTNASVQHRGAVYDGKINASWMYSEDFGGTWADRGTGYNQYETAWDDAPFSRIEDERTGWPNLLVTGNGRVISISHTSDYHLLMTYKDPGDASWTQVDLPNALPSGLLWPRAAVGGPLGDVIHVIGLTTPQDFGGVNVGGQDGALSYYRSSDNGNTWDIQDFLIPHLDSSNYLNFSADMYDLHARGNRVALALFHDWADSKVLVSEDNGLNWSATRMLDFPVDLFDVDNELLDVDGDLLADTVTSTDNTGQVYIDNALNIHVVYGGMQYLDEIQFDGSWSYFPGWSGLNYWNESMGSDSSMVIANLIDANGDEFFDFGNSLAIYGSNLTSMASIGEDSSGNIYVAYAGLTETHTDGEYNRRHIYVTKTLDSGTTWESAIDVTPDEDYFLLEYVYPSIVQDEGDLIHIIAQRDYTAGISVNGDLTSIDLNDIVHVVVDQNLVPIEVIQGCTDSQACNYADDAECDDGSCVYPGCTNSEAINYDPAAGCDDGSCVLLGCLEIGNPAWANIETGVFPFEVTYMEWGVPFVGELVFNVREDYFDGGTGNTFPIVHISIESTSNLPTILELDLPGINMPSSSQHCIALTGTPAQEGLFEVIFNCDITVSVFGTNVVIPDIPFSHFIQVDPNVNGIPGCMYAFAPNYNQFATYDDGSCLPQELSSACGEGTIWDDVSQTCISTNDCPSDLDNDGLIATSDLLIFLIAYGNDCD